MHSLSGSERAYHHVTSSETDAHAQFSAKQSVLYDENVTMSNLLAS